MAGHCRGRRFAVGLRNGNGPFHAVVLLHSCSGLDTPATAVELAWADIFLANGYAVGLADSFRPRCRSGGVCARSGIDWVAPHIRGTDAHKALRVLQDNPKIDANRISVMGRSNGGVATLAANNVKMIADANLPTGGRPGFRSAITFYPECGITYGDWVATKRQPNQIMAGTYQATAPMMIPIGRDDDWTPVKPCENLLSAATGASVSMKVYPGAHHSFDYPRGGSVIYMQNATNINWIGAHVGPNPAALADSRQQVLKFLADPTYRP